MKRWESTQCLLLSVKEVYNREDSSPENAKDTLGSIGLKPIQNNQQQAIAGMTSTNGVREKA